MRITKVDLESFGSVHGFFADLGDSNMTLIYGDNEAGKTTIMEFIRSTVFPGKAPRYPVPRKTDCGSLTVEMSDGGTRVLKREQRKVTEQDGKLLPSQELGMDAETYRSLFALDLDQLTNDKMLSDGEFRKRFLTVPGGENVPEVTKSIRSRMDELMSKERLTDARIVGHLYREVKKLESEVYAASEEDDAFDALSAEKDRLSIALAEAKSMSQAAAYEENREFMLDSLKDNMKTLENLKARRQALSESDALTDELVRREAELRTRISALDELLEAQAEPERTDFGKMCAGDIMSLAPEIEEAWSARSRIGMLDGTVRDLRASIEADTAAINALASSHGMTPEELIAVAGRKELRDTVEGRMTRELSAYQKHRYSRMLMAGGAVIAAVGVGMAAMGLPVPGAVAVIAGALAAASPFLLPRIRDKLGSRDRTDWPALMRANGLPETDREGARRLFADSDTMSELSSRRELSASRLEAFSAELDELQAGCMSVCSRLGTVGGTIEENLDDMYSVYVLAKSAVQSFSESDGLSDKRRAAEDELNAIYGRFGGEEDFRRLRSMKDEARELDLSISALTDAVESAAGMTSDIIGRSSDATNRGMSREEAEQTVDSINVRLGEINTRMKQIRDADAAAELKVRLDVQRAMLREASMEWAVLSLADNIIGECSDRFYADMQPGVMKTANRYLDLMTEGRYRLASDPRDSEISIEDRRGKKYDGEWSSGLGDQVYLAVKMAIAKEMGSERLPFVMDDVLVRFDARRKQGACRAIMDFARDQQAIMFTCDSSLVSMFRLEGQLNYIMLP